MLFPDTSPRGAKVEGSRASPRVVSIAALTVFSSGEEDSWDFGTGAGFYLDATHPKYRVHYNMLSHITVELPDVLEEAGIPIDWRRKSIFGHSMGGHGALTIYLQSLQGSNPYKSVSAFAPIANAVEAPWGQKAFTGYLQGGIEEARLKYDATELVSKTRGPLRILIHSVRHK
jgi:S-formylglutathione hydrolase